MRLEVHAEPQELEYQAFKCPGRILGLLEMAQTPLSWGGGSKLHPALSPPRGNFCLCVSKPSGLGAGKSGRKRESAAGSSARPTGLSEEVSTSKFCPSERVTTSVSKFFQQTRSLFWKR
jgi:hypothetical protein